LEFLGFQTFFPLGSTDTDDDPNLSQGLLLKNDNLYAYSSFMLGSSEFPRYLDEIIESGML
jgi:hypothetical protein